METNQNETREFQAEVKQLLNIVVNSLYTDREIFLRELISNSADALEKLRYIKITEKEVQDQDVPLEINIDTDENNHTLTITDSGIGMTKEELNQNLGTIAHSGSRAFLSHLAEGGSKDVNIIGQFGVGFYSVFMVADKVMLYTRSYQPKAEGCLWSSEGSGSYTVGKVENLTRGTKIIVHLKEDARDFAKPETVKRIIKQYSGFVPFTITLNGEQINTVQAIWTKNKNEIKEEEYNEFYKYVANAYDEPLMRLHFSADAPLSINALLFVPKDNFERYGFGRTEPGVNIYCRKVLIQQQAGDILPEWLRFLRGVIDSEELPLNISRETMQDSSLVARLRKVITGRFLKFLNEQSRTSKEKYKEFWDKFSMFIKEGATSDFTYRKDLVKLMRFESSASKPGELVSLEEYIERMKEGQNSIYYINGPTREAIESGPYFEIFKQREIEVLYTHEPVDDYVLSQLGEYEGKKLLSGDQVDLDLPGDSKGENKAQEMSKDEVKDLVAWLKQVFGDKVTEVRQSNRLVDSPAIALGAGGSTHSMQRMMQMLNRDFSNMGSITLELNTSHSLIRHLNAMRTKDENFARTIAEQVLDNALISAGLIMDPRDMIDRIYKIMDRAISE